MKLNLKWIKLNRNKGTLLLVLLVAVLLIALSTSRLLEANQATSGNKPATDIQESESETDGGEEESGELKGTTEFDKDSENNNALGYEHSKTEFKSVKGTDTKSQTKPKSNSSQNQKPQTQFVILEINTGTGSYSYNVSWQENLSVYDALEASSQKNKFSLESSWYAGIGSYYVTEIHGVGCCWVYTLNNEKVSLGASLTIVEPGDVISWKHL